MFYSSLCGNVVNEFTIDEIDEQFLSDFLDALNPAFGAVAMQKVSYDMLPGATNQISEAIAAELRTNWGEANGINVTRVSIASVTPTGKSAEMIKAAQKDRLYAQMNTPINPTQPPVPQEPAPQSVQATPSSACSNCGAEVNGKFCGEYGTKFEG